MRDAPILSAVKNVKSLAMTETASHIRVIQGKEIASGGHVRSWVAQRGGGRGWEGGAPGLTDPKPLKRLHASEKPANLVGVHGPWPICAYWAEANIYLLIFD